MVGQNSHSYFSCFFVGFTLWVLALMHESKRHTLDPVVFNILAQVANTLCAHARLLATHLE